MSGHERKSLLWVLAVALAVAATAWACGPDFPNQLLTDRNATLDRTPANTFVFEASHLVPAKDALKASEPAPYRQDAYRARMAAAANAGLDSARIEQLAGLAGLDGEQAWQRSAGLPEAIRLYAAAAADFHGGSTCATGSSASPKERLQASQCKASPAQLVQAARRFQAVLDLPAAQRQPRAVAAAYMLGRIAWLQLLDCDGCKPRELIDEVHRQFAAARELARHGAPDPKGLAVASYGEEARVYLHRANSVAGGSYCGWQGFISGAACPATIAPADYRHAIALYAEQTARGSRSGLDSLHYMARYALDHPALGQALVEDSLSRRLLVAYALAMNVDDMPPASVARLQTLVTAIDRQDVALSEGADRLASLAYGIGRYDLATRLAGQAHGPLANWIQAKLALHRGDLAAADAAYAQAIKGFPTLAAGTPSADPSSPVLDPGNLDLLKGEHGVLALARGDYVEAMRHLYEAAQAVGGDGNVYPERGGSGPGYGNDVAYLAERVLTIDELKGFVDTYVPAPAPLPPSDRSSDRHAPRPLAGNLRWLLARRLMREGQYDVAQAYFPPRDDRRFGTADLRKLAQDYAAALHQAAHAWTDIGRAQGWYAAAVIAREHGMELLGYAQEPDYQFMDGNYEGGAGLGPDQLKGPHVTAGERARHGESGARPDRRFHYRYVAADQASHAANLLPPRSQAFAAVLCQATGWMLAGPPDYHDHFAFGEAPRPGALPERLRRAEALYRRYVRQGPYVSWAANFGRHCEAPDFDGARRLLRHQRIGEVRHALRPYLPYGLLGVFVILAAGLGGWRLRRRKRQARG